MNFLLNTLLGFVITQVSDILTRTKSSEDSPIRFDFIFFLKDTYLKIILSLVLSISLSVALYNNVTDAPDFITNELGRLSGWVYIIIGFAPERILQFVKKKYGVLQPKCVEGYDRTVKKEDKKKDTPE